MSKKILVLGANGQIARFAIDLFLKNTDFKLTLFARKANRLKSFSELSGRVEIVEGDVLEYASLEKACCGHDVVYANLDGDLLGQAKNIVRAMKAKGLTRLIFISSMGIYDEVPGQQYKSVLNPYRDSALMIEASDLDYTIIRPEWLNDKDEIDYGLTHKGEPFKNEEKFVSRKSVADLIVKLASTPNYEIKQSLGVHKP